MTDRSWESFVRARIFQPLGMSNTFFLHQGPLDASRLATGYDLEGESLLAIDYPEHYDSYIPTAAGLFSTTGDLARLIRALGTDSLLTDASKQAMWTPTSFEDDGFEGWNGVTSGYGIGWTIAAFLGHRRVWTSGGGMTTVHHYPDADLTVILLSNLSGASPNGVAEDVATLFFDAN